MVEGKHAQQLCKCSNNILMKIATTFGKEGTASNWGYITE